MAANAQTKRALVTGGAGFIGSHVAEALLADGFSVAVVDNLSTGKKQNLEQLGNKASLHVADITSAEQLAAVFAKEKPEIVFHLAAQANARTSIANPLLDAQTNVLGSINVLECCRKYDVKKIVYSSSCAVYGHPQSNPVSEASALLPVCPYGASKLAVEHYLSAYNRIYGIEYCALRYANVFGPRQDGKGEGGAIAVFTERLLSSQPLVINGDGEQTRDFVFVKDVAKANLAAAKISAPSLVCNIGAGKEVSLNKVVSVLSGFAGANRAPLKGPAVAGEVKRICLNVELAKTMLSWRPTVDLEVGLKQTVDWARSQNLKRS